MLGSLEKTVVDRPDPRALAAFNCEVLGMQVSQDVGDWVIISLGPDRRDLAFEQGSSPRWWCAPVAA